MIGYLGARAFRWAVVVYVISLLYLLAAPFAILVLVSVLLVRFGAAGIAWAERRLEPKSGP